MKYEISHSFDNFLTVTEWGVAKDIRAADVVSSCHWLPVWHSQGQFNFHACKTNDLGNKLARVFLYVYVHVCCMCLQHVLTLNK